MSTPARAGDRTIERGINPIACTKTLEDFGIANLVVCDTPGAIHAGRDVGRSPANCG